MLLFILAYVGGVLTIVSPCILPVLPFVFARADRPFLRNGLPMLAGMALTFALVGTLAAVAGEWAVRANELGRGAAVALLALFGVALLWPGLADRLARPLVALGARLSASSDAPGASTEGGLVPALLLGVATGLLWAPCAGPVLGLILTGAALQGANAQTSLLLLAYAAGAATSLALALAAGGRVYKAMKRSLHAGEWLRRGLGVAVLAAVAAIALGLDTGVLAQASLASTGRLEQVLVQAWHGDDAPAPSASVVMSGDAMMSGAPAMMAASSAMMMGGAPGMMMSKDHAAAATELNVEGAAPSISGAVQWLNSQPLSTDALKGKVVLIDFWTYSCINCLRTMPYVRAWADKYKSQGLVVVGVHTPEFAFEKNLANVQRAVTDLKVGYPVAVDNDYAIWRAFGNRYWPAHYFIDAQGRVRHHHFGEGGYEESERVIQRLLAEAGQAKVAADLVSVAASGAAAAADAGNVQSPETYVGYERAENFVSPGGVARDARHSYRSGEPRLNEWGLAGDWTVTGEHAQLDAADGAIVYRFHARDLHLVLGPAAAGKPVRFRVTIDGAAPGQAHGADVDAQGLGTIDSQRLYQLVRQRGVIGDRSFEIRFLDPGVRAYAFTFG